MNLEEILKQVERLDEDGPWAITLCGKDPSKGEGEHELILWHETAGIIFPLARTVHTLVKRVQEAEEVIKRVHTCTWGYLDKWGAR